MNRFASPPLVMDFSGVYADAPLLPERPFTRLDCRAFMGTDCYCDADGTAALRHALAPFPPHGLHFLDSGNYHYVTAFWLEKIDTPFNLVVFDHHPDTQPPAWGDSILSCGGWIAYVARTNPHVQSILVAGPPTEAIDGVDAPLRQRIFFLDEATLKDDPARFQTALDALPPVPVYLSIDKDVLDPAEVSVNWDQGTVGWDTLRTRLDALAAHRTLLGVDVCGEPAPGQRDAQDEPAIVGSVRVNSRLAAWTAHLCRATCG